MDDDDDSNNNNINSLQLYSNYCVPGINHLLSSHNNNILR